MIKLCMLRYTLTCMIHGYPCCSESTIYFKVHRFKLKFLNPQSLLINFTVRLKKRVNICFYTQDFKMVTTCFSLFYDYEKKCSELDLTSVHVEMNKKVITVFLDTNNTSYDITVTFILSISINIFCFFMEKFCLYFNC